MAGDGKDNSEVCLGGNAYLECFSLSCFLFLGDEGHHHVLIPRPVDGRGVGRGASAVTPGGHLPVTL